MKYLYPFLWLLVISVLSLTPSAKMPSVHLFPNADKLIHLVMYGIFSFLLMPPFKASRRRELRFFIPFIVSSSIGILFEYLQLMLRKGRSFEFLDIVADVLGAAVGIFIYWLIVRSLSKREIEE
ncbi:MAG TPA: VanZ family protein [Prolixibacteraceae bacterium]|nr:VanZ family protein [Prolixibacteraceae bacterium]HPS11683.1 VanZ family protein [Prolixibacteraceae bacterium]